MDRNRNKTTECLLHVAIWAVMFVWPLMFMNRGNGVSALQILFMSMAQLTLMATFYINYAWLTPKFYIGGNKRFFWVFNAVMIVCLSIALHYWMEMTHHLFDPNRPRPAESLHLSLIFTLRDMFNLMIAAAIATTIQLSKRWQASESARQQAEAARTEAELRNLRTQLNPHFLLNTLNNIYALTAIDAQRAQTAIQELSKLLRHVLYDNEEQFTDVKDEVQFLQNYVNLMKIRLPESIDVRLTANIPEPCRARIAPLLFISLVENAFKHGVSMTAKSFVHIDFTATDDRIECCIENSNHPKNASDHSGHGIGLKQVASRLELLYHGKYEWTKSVNTENTVYTSKIIIYDTKLRDN